MIISFAHDKPSVYVSVTTSLYCPITATFFSSSWGAEFSAPSAGLSSFRPKLLILKGTLVNSSKSTVIYADLVISPL